MSGTKLAVAANTALVSGGSGGALAAVMTYAGANGAAIGVLIAGFVAVVGMVAKIYSLRQISKHHRRMEEIAEGKQDD